MGLAAFFKEKQGFLGGRSGGQERIVFLPGNDCLLSSALALLSSINKHPERWEKPVCDKEPSVVKISSCTSNATTPKRLGALGISHQCQPDSLKKRKI